MLQLRRPFKALSPNWCILCRRSREMIDHLFLHCPINLGLWHRIFSQARMEWVQPSSICNMLVISFKCFGNSIRGKSLWRITSLSLSVSYGLCGERNIRIFEDIWKMSEMMWDQLHSHVSFWAYYIDILKPYPLSVIQLSWLPLCTP